jgi:hypothetical protein
LRYSPDFIIKDAISSVSYCSIIRKENHFELIISFLRGKVSLTRLLAYMTSEIEGWRGALLLVLLLHPLPTSCMLPMATGKMRENITLPADDENVMISARNLIKPKRELTS